VIRTLCFHPQQEPCAEIPISQFDDVLRDPQALLWVDFENESDEMAESILTGIFRFHPLAVDDALQQTHSPKVDDWKNYLYIVLNSLEMDEEGKLRQHELDVFLGKNYIVTHHDHPLGCLRHTRESCLRDARHISQGADHLLYKLLDDLVAAYMPIVSRLDEQIDEMEDKVLDNPKSSTLQELFALKRALQILRRTITPQREVLNKLARDSYEVIDPHDRIFFRDIYDHLVRLHDLNESMRDLVGSALDTYLSAVNNRMNDVMKTLTIITTLFMPISFLTGFFGMNFFEPSAGLLGWTSLPAFLFTLLIFLLLPLAMYRWMKKQTWI